MTTLCKLRPRGREYPPILVRRHFSFPFEHLAKLGRDRLLTYSLKRPEVINLWRRRMPIVMWLDRIDRREAPAKEREDYALLETILEFSDTGAVAAAVRLQIAFEFERPQTFIRDYPWHAVTSAVQALLPQLPPNLEAALMPFVVPHMSHRRIGEAWDAGAAAAFPEIASEIKRITGKAA